MTFNIKNFKLLGHRGAAGLAPENTHASLIAAHKQGAQGVEMDVTLLKDGTAVIFHDQTVDRLTKKTGFLNQLTYEEVASLKIEGSTEDSCEGDCTLLTLDAALDIIEQYQMTLNLELKCHDGSATLLADTVQKIIKKHRYFDTNHLIFSSFDFNVLNIIKEYYMPEANIGILYKNKTDPWLDQAKALNAQTINPPHKLITPDLIRAIKNENYDIMTWTVNHYETAQNLYGLGVDAIITDYPNRLALLIKS